MRLFVDLSVSRRINVAIAVIVALLAAVSSFAIERSMESSRAMSSMIDGAFLANSKMLEMDGNVVRIHRAMKDVALARSTADVDLAIAAIPELERSIDEELSVVRARGRVDVSLLAQVRSGLATWHDFREQTIDLIRAGKAEEAGARTKAE